MNSWKWFVEMPDGTLRAGLAWPDYRCGDWANKPPEAARHITENEFHRRTLAPDGVGCGNA